MFETARRVQILVRSLKPEHYDMREWPQGDVEERTPILEAFD